MSAVAWGPFAASALVFVTSVAVFLVVPRSRRARAELASGGAGRSSAACEAGSRVSARPQRPTHVPRHVAFIMDGNRWSATYVWTCFERKKRVARSVMPFCLIPTLVCRRRYGQRRFGAERRLEGTLYQNLPAESTESLFSKKCALRLRKKRVERDVGHAEGGKKLGEVVEWCIDAGVEQMTCFAFSTENWNRGPGAARRRPTGP